MNKLYYLAALAAVALSLGFTACDDDDVINNKPEREKRDTQYRLKAFMQLDRIGTDDDQTQKVLQTYHETLHQLDSIGEKDFSMTVSVKGTDSLACINALLDQCKKADATLANQELKGDASTISILLESNYEVLFSKTYGIGVTDDNATTGTASGKFGDNIYWSYADGTLTISGTGAMKDLTSTWALYSCYMDAPWYVYSPKVKKLVIEEGITHIGDFNFSTLPATEIQLPKTLASIGQRSFNECKYLQSIELPESLTEIKSQAFSWSGLTSVILPANVRTIQNGAFAGTALKNLSLPEGIEEIGESAFEECNNLQSVTIPGTVKTVSQCTFFRCESLETVNIQEGIEEIGNFAFSSCYSIKTISLPSTLKKIKTSAFNNAYDVRDIYCYATTPPAFAAGLSLPYYYEDESQVVIHVPGSSIEAYKADKNWSRYPDYVAL